METSYDGSSCVVVDNPIAAMNTNFETNPAGNGIVQAKDGYNVEGFPCKAKLIAGVENDLPGDYIYFQSFFTKDAIKKGAELRVDYGYTDKEAQAAVFDCATIDRSRRYKFIPKAHRYYQRDN